MRDVTGEQYAQVDNADPFASPVWRSPVYRTPEWVIWLVQLARLLVRVIWFLIRHPLLDAAAGVIALTWAEAGWPGLAGPGRASPLASLVTLRLCRPGLVRPAGHRAGAEPVAVVVLPAPLAGRHDHQRPGPDLPGPGHRSRCSARSRLGRAPTW